MMNFDLLEREWEVRAVRQQAFIRLPLCPVQLAGCFASISALVMTAMVQSNDIMYPHLSDEATEA